MRVLFDQGTPIAIAEFLVARHVVRTTREEGWERLVNGDLLQAAESAGFEVLLTTDNGFGYQQNLSGRKIAIVVLSRNKWRTRAASHPENRGGGRCGQVRELRRRRGAGLLVQPRGARRFPAESIASLRP